MENICRMERFSAEELQNLLFFMLEGSDKIKDDEVDETNMCAGSDEEYEIKLHHLNRKF
jgi:hypothetical protein